MITYYLSANFPPMNYLILLVIGILGYILYRYFFKKYEPKSIDQIRASWGVPKEENFDFEKIGFFWKYHSEIDFFEINEQTQKDLDFTALFSFIDRTTSRPGQQFLYHILKRPTNNLQELKQRDSNANFFKEKIDLRETIQKHLRHLNSYESYFIPLLLKGRMMNKPKWFFVFYLDIFLIILLIFLSIKIHLFILGLILLFSINNAYSFLKNKDYIFQLSNGFTQLNILINVCKKILPHPIPFQKDKTLFALSQLKELQRKINIVYYGDDGRDNDDIGKLPIYIFTLLKGMFLVEVFVLESILKELEKNKENILNLFEYIGNLDLAISIASLRDGKLKYCTPEFIKEEKSLKVKNIQHPLIQDCIENSLEVKGKSVLITGSNMSGKTSFLRTLGINTLLAQTLFTCFAEEFKSPFLLVLSSIQIDDNLFEGKSYYLAEVEVIGKLVEKAKESHQTLFILDEVFKGTNSQERIAAGKSILSYLNQKNHLVFVATHDLELSTMLMNEFDLYHFSEDIQNDELNFDHKIKPGPLKTTNAIKILELYHFPKEITQEAQLLRGQIFS